MSQATGLLYALVAAVAFGIQYVPVKKYEIFEGTAFQWFMCNGILMVVFIIAAASGELERGISPLVIFGGVLWALSNYLVLPLVKLLGIGLGFSLYHFVNLMVGYCIGRFGLFGVKKLTGELIYCDIGCFLVLASFFAMVFVEAGHESKDDSDSEGSSDESALSAEWEYARAHSMDPMAAECDVRFMATGGFSVFGVPEGDHPLGKKHGQIDLSRHEHITSLDCLGPGAQRLLGVILAILAGGLCGVQGVPATLWEASHPEAEAFAVALPQCIGIWVCSSGILILYSSVVVIRGVRLKKSVIGPAYASGCIWGVGFACMMKGISFLGYSVGYTLDAVGPILVSSLLSVFVFREITAKKPLLIYFGAFSLQLVGVLLIACFGEPS